MILKYFIPKTLDVTYAFLSVQRLMSEVIWNQNYEEIK